MDVLLWIQSQKLPELTPSIPPNWAQTVETCFFSMVVGHKDFSFTVFWDIYPVPSFPLSLPFHLLGSTLLQISNWFSYFQTPLQYWRQMILSCMLIL